MYEQVVKPKKNKSKAVPNSVAQKMSKKEQSFGFVDNRSVGSAQTKLQKMANEHAEKQELPIQKKENKTGLPDNLKAGIENLSGYSMDDIKVHYNSAKPSQLQAHAYAQGTDIHLAPGQEKHLPHEAWHVVQQMQGRVKPTLQTQDVAINDDRTLEREADKMGVKAASINKSRAVANSVGQKKSNGNRGFGFIDNRPEAVAKRKLKDMANGNSQAKQSGQFQLVSTNVNSPDVNETASVIQRVITVPQATGFVMAHPPQPHDADIYQYLAAYGDVDLNVALPGFDWADDYAILWTAVQAAIAAAPVAAPDTRRTVYAAPTGRGLTVYRGAAATQAAQALIAAFPFDSYGAGGNAGTVCYFTGDRTVRRRAGGAVNIDVPAGLRINDVQSMRIDFQGANTQDNGNGMQVQVVRFALQQGDVTYAAVNVEDQANVGAAYIRTAFTQSQARQNNAHVYSV